MPQVQRYGILSPAMGIREDFPNIRLSEAFLEDAENTQLRWGEIHRAKMRTKYIDQSPDTNPFLKYHWHKSHAGVTYLFGFTEDNVYLYDQSGNVGDEAFTGAGLDDLESSGTYTGVVSRTYRVHIDATGTPDTFKWSNDGGSTWEATGVSITGAAQVLEYGVTVTFGATTGHTLNDYWDMTAANGAWTSKKGSTSFSNVTEWSVVSYGNAVIATNNSSKVIFWDGTASSGNFGYLGGASGLEYASGVYMTKCKFLAVFENYLWFFNTTENAEVYPQRGRFSDISATPSLTMTINSGDASYADFEGHDHLMTAGIYRDFLIVFKEDSTHRMWLDISDLVFGKAVMHRGLGCKAPRSIVNAKSGNLYFFASDKTFREIQLGEVSQPMDKTIKNLDDSYIKNIQGHFVDEYGEIWWAVTSVDGATQNDLALTYNEEDKVWNKRDIPVSAFGIYERGGNKYTWDTLPYPTWDDWDWDQWDSIEANPSFVTDICGDYSGYTFNAHDGAQDNGSAYTGYFVLATDLAGGRMLTKYKRVLNIYLYFRPFEGGTATISVKRDNEGSFQSLGSISLAGTSEIVEYRLPCDFRGKHFLLKWAASNKFEFVGYIIEFVEAGDR